MSPSDQGQSYPQSRGNPQGNLSSPPELSNLLLASAEPTQKPSKSENNTEKKKANIPTTSVEPAAAAERITQNRSEEQKSSALGDTTLSLDWLGKISVPLEPSNLSY